MPRKIEWTRNISRALCEIEAIDCAVVDRAGLEKLLDLSPRQALRVMVRFPNSYYAGKSLVIGRSDLVAALEAVLAGEEGQREQRRRARLSDKLDAARRELAGRRVRITAPSSATEYSMPGLPADVHLQPGELRIEFARTDDLLRQLYELSQAILSDYTGFRKMAEPVDPHEHVPVRLPKE